MPHTQGQNIKLLPTYGVDNFGTKVFLPILDSALTAQTVDISAGTITQSTDGGFRSINETDILYSDTGTMQLLHAGNDTAFDQTYRWRPSMSAVIYKTEILLGVGLNVSSFTSGVIDLSDLTIQIGEAGQVEVAYKNTFPITMTAKTGASPAWFIFHLTITEPFKVYSSNPIDVNIQINAASETGVSTTQTGLLPIFPYTTADVMKPFVPSGITFHMNASLDRSDPTFNEDIERVV